jgi:hypothetical protein
MGLLNLLRGNSTSNVETSNTVKQFIVWLNIQRITVNIDILAATKEHYRIESEQRELAAWRRQLQTGKRLPPMVGFQTICCLEPELLKTKFAKVEMHTKDMGSTGSLSAC